MNLDVIWGCHQVAHPPVQIVNFKCCSYTKPDHLDRLNVLKPGSGNINNVQTGDANLLGLQELEARLRLDASAARQEILQMCEGMKRITLPVSTNAEVSSAFLFTGFAVKAN